MLLTIHELEIDKAAGTKLRQALDDANAPEELRNAVTEAMRAIRKSQSRAQRQFAYLRNATIAHRDPDAIRQYRDIVEIDGLEVTKVSAEFYEGNFASRAIISDGEGSFFLIHSPSLSRSLPDGSTTGNRKRDGFPLINSQRGPHW